MSKESEQMLSDLDKQFENDPLKEVEFVVQLAALATGSTISRPGDPETIPATGNRRGNKYALCRCGSRELYANCCGKLSPTTSEAKP